MPHRVYGHNFLDRNHLVQITVGHPSRNSSMQGVRLHHRLISTVFRDEYLVSSAPLKLVMTTMFPQVSAPYSISLPQKGKDVFTFQIPDLESLSLEFSVYPNFGTKTIGRAIALQSSFRDCTSGTHEFTLPILDTHLHVIGEVSDSHCADCGYLLRIGRLRYQYHHIFPRCAISNRWGRGNLLEVHRTSRRTSHTTGGFFVHWDQGQVGLAPPILPLCKA